MKYFSMFSGIGGFDIALNRQNHECIGYSEIDKYAIQTYEKNFGKEVRNYGDARTINPDELSDFDLLCGGFPCQTFSIAGKRRGFEDTRGTLFFEIARILKAKRPSYFLLENVKGLLSHDKGRTFEIITQTLNNLGYLVNYEVHNSKNFGVPQNRERVFFKGYEICKFVEDGLIRKENLSQIIIQDFLFQLLLKNLKEVKKLQEHRLKEWILAWLLWKEIYQSLNQSEKEKIKDGRLIPMEERLLELSKENMWQSIDLLLKNIWEENYLGQNKFTISTVIKQITDWETYTYSKMLHCISLVIVHLRNSSDICWKKILSDLIIIREGMKYARIMDETKDYIITEYNTAYQLPSIEGRERVFIIGNIRGKPKPEILPIKECGGETKELVYAQKSDREIARVYSPDGVAPTLHLKTGGWQEPKIAIKAKFQKTAYNIEGISPTFRDGHNDGVRIAIPVLTPDRAEKRQNGRRFKENGEPFFTLTGQDKHGVMIRDGRDNRSCLRAGRTPEVGYSGMSIRRLTPTECERLQGFPDGWTEGVSDTRRYNQLGNAVTVNVIATIIEQMFSLTEVIL